jgi:hypothetical protein
MAKLIVAARNFAKASKNYEMHYCILTSAKNETLHFRK